MSIIDSNARWEDEDKAMSEWMDQMDAETAAVYDNEVYPTPAEEKVMDADLRYESAERHLMWLEELDPDDWEYYGAETGLSYFGALGQAQAESIKAKEALDQAVAELRKQDKR